MMHFATAINLGSGAACAESMHAKRAEGPLQAKTAQDETKQATRLPHAPPHPVAKRTRSCTDTQLSREKECGVCGPPIPSCSSCPACRKALVLRGPGAALVWALPYKRRGAALQPFSLPHSLALVAGGGGGGRAIAVWSYRADMVPIARLLWLSVAALFLRLPGSVCNNRHAIHWNSSNHHLRREGYTVQVNVNDYLDIYCPHYNESSPEHKVEQYILFMVNYDGYRTCNTSQGSKRWECNRPHSVHSPIKFSEKFQRYSAFSLGYEFHAGHEYYYISTPTHNHRRACLRMKVFVCCASSNFNPEIPKLEKSISGTSPKREHLHVTVAISLFLMTFLAS
ncbi:ephrin-A3 isoform X2 [Microcaecilia unicolor]|uniref:Ephrin-A3 n=1 Tax=Microcaecilia unicolor TaxID=1415580 RepID=A0A6P7WRI4_9AMPH|nr:ephrin-A3 isoform X2 [Microcaecilia unicolor]